MDGATRIGAVDRACCPVARTPRRFYVRRRSKSRQISVSSGLRWEIERDRARAAARSKRGFDVRLRSTVPTACPHCPESYPADQMRENGARARVDDGAAVGAVLRQRA